MMKLKKKKKINPKKLMMNYNSNQAKAPSQGITNKLV